MFFFTFFSHPIEAWVRFCNRIKWIEQQAIQNEIHSLVRCSSPISMLCKFKNETYTGVLAFRCKKASMRTCELFHMCVISPVCRFNMKIFRVYLSIACGSQGCELSSICLVSRTEYVYKSHSTANRFIRTSDSMMCDTISRETERHRERERLDTGYYSQTIDFNRLCTKKAINQTNVWPQPYSMK